MEANSSTKLQDIECLHGKHEGQSCRDGGEDGRCRNLCVNSLASPVKLRTYLARKRIEGLQENFAYVASQEHLAIHHQSYMDAVKHDLSELDRIFGERQNHDI